MATKKDLLKRIEQLEEQVRCLENMHARVVPFTTKGSGLTFAQRTLEYDKWVYKGKVANYYNRQLTAREILMCNEHPYTREHTAWTKKIPDVTHEELARFVLDGTPIQRKEERRAYYTTAYIPGIKTTADIGVSPIEQESEE